MKFLALVVAFAAVFISQTDAIFIDWRLAGIQESLVRVAGQLQKIKRSLQDEIESKKAEADKLATASIDQMTEAIESAQAEGKNIGECSMDLNSAHTQAVKDYNKEITECFAQYLTAFEEKSQKINDLITEGENFKTNYENLKEEHDDEGILNLYSSAKFILQTPSLLPWKFQVRKEKKLPVNATTLAKKSIAKCIEPFFKKFESNLSNANGAASECLESLDLPF